MEIIQAFTFGPPSVPLLRCCTPCFGPCPLLRFWPYGAHAFTVRAL